MQDKIFIQYSGVVFLFYQCTLSDYFCFQIVVSAVRWDKTFSSNRSGLEPLSAINFSWFIGWHLSEILIVPIAQWVGQRGSEAVGTGTNPSFYLHFSTLLLQQKIVISPSPIMRENFRYQNFFWNTEGFSYEIFRYCETKYSTEKRDTFPSPSDPWNFSITEFFWNTEGFSYEIFRDYETKKFRRKNVISPLMYENFC